MTRRRRNRGELMGSFDLVCSLRAFSLVAPYGYELSHSAQSEAVEE